METNKNSNIVALNIRKVLNEHLRARIGDNGEQTIEIDGAIEALSTFARKHAIEYASFVGGPDYIDLEDVYRMFIGERII